MGDSVERQFDDTPDHEQWTESQASATIIPQITLTEAANDANVNSQSPRSNDDSLSPHSTSYSTTYEQSPQPLPLTRDVLQQKNRMDIILRRQSLSRKRASSSFATPSAVDERVTDGLGISTPGERRQRRSSTYQRLKSILTQSSSSIVEQDRQSYPSSPHTSTRLPWYNDTQSLRPTSNASQFSIKEPDIHAPSSTMSLDKPYSAPDYGKYSLPYNTRHKDHYSSSTPIPPQSFHDNFNAINTLGKKDHRHWAVAMVCNAATRVVHTRASELGSFPEMEKFPLKRKESQKGPPSDTGTMHDPEMSAITKESSSPWIPDPNGYDTEKHAPEAEPAPLYDWLYPLQGNSLFLFRPSNPIRIAAWKLIRSRHVETFLLVLIILHYFVMACVPILENEQKTVFSGQWNQWVILAIQTIYTIEIICKSIAFGFFLRPRMGKEQVWAIFKRMMLLRGFEDRFGNTSDMFGQDPANSQYLSTSSPDMSASRRNISALTKEHQEELIEHHKAFLDSPGNILDCITVVCYWIDFALMMNGVTSCSLFKAAAAARPLRLMLILPGTAVIMKSLETGFVVLRDVFILILLVTFLFALIGLVSYVGVFSRRCYAIDAEGETSLVEPAIYCSGYFNGSQVMGPYNAILDRYSYAEPSGIFCMDGQMCMEYPSNNPNFGFVNYDTIFSSFLSVYTFTSMELWTTLMYQNQDGDSSTAALFYCVGVYLIGFILVYLFYAAIMSSFSHVRAETSVSAFSGKKKGRQALLQHFDNGDGASDESIWAYDDPTRRGGLSSHLHLRRFLISLVKSKIFFYLGYILVFIDFVFMCMRSFYVSDDMIGLIDDTETGITLVFAVEIILRMAGAVSWPQFWKSNRNKIDLFLVIATCIIQLPAIHNSDAYMYLTIFQVLRLYRFFLCFPRVRKLINLALGTGENVINVLIFLVLTSFLICPVFMQMFGGDFNTVTQPDDPELRFDTVWQSFLAAIVLYTSETWTGILYNAMASQSGYGSIYAAIFVCGYFAFSRYVIAGLYISVILENFELDDEYIKDYQIKQFIQKHSVTKKGTTNTMIQKLIGPLYMSTQEKSVQIAKLPTRLTAPVTESVLAEIYADEKEESREESAPSDSILPARLKNTLMPTTNKSKIDPAIDPIVEIDEVDDYDRIVAEEDHRAMEDDQPKVKSLFLFSERSKIRQWCRILTGSRISTNRHRIWHVAFNWFIVACVILGTVIIIFDEPPSRKLREDMIAQSAFVTIETALGVIFMVEVTIRIIADGLILPPGAYLRNCWNFMDFCIVVLNFITMYFWAGSQARALNTIRCLRALRLIRYLHGIKEIYTDLFYALPLMLDAMVLTFLFLFPFAVYGVNIFNGLFWLCNDDSVDGQISCVGEFINNVSSDDDPNTATLILVPRTWNNPADNFYSYDNFPQALLQMFTLTSTEGWVDSMFSAMSTPSSPGLQPSFSWDSPYIYNSIFYVVFMILSHGTVQFFVGVIIENFKRRTGISTLTVAQRQYADLKRQLERVKPTIKVYRPTSWFRGWCYDLVAKRHGLFNRCMMGVIFLNICVLSTEFQNESIVVENFQDYAFLGFVIVYVAEVFIKVTGLGWTKWRTSKWNWYDLTIAASALLMVAMRMAIPTLWTVRVERYCLVFAAFRLAEGIDALENLYHTIASSVPIMGKILLVFLLVMCLFGMVFMEFFGLTKYGPNANEHTNFRNFGNTLLLLVRMTTGEGWNSLLNDYLVEYPNCVYSDNYLESDCGDPGWAYFLFNFFYIVCTHIFLNLFIATIISQFEYTYETKSRFTQFTNSDLRKFKSAWAQLDPNASGYICKEDVAPFLRLLTGRLALRLYEDSHSLENLIRLSRCGPDGSVRPSMVHDEKYFEKNSSFCMDYNLTEVNKCLATMNKVEQQRRRREYNLCYVEILGTETSKGIAFEDVLTIMSLRFLNIEESFQIEPLIHRLEKLEKLHKRYAFQKAQSVLMAFIARKQFLHRLWQKRNEDEVTQLGIQPYSGLRLNTSGIRLDLPPPDGFLNTPSSQHKRPPVPRIVVDEATLSPMTQAHAVPVSPISLNVPNSPMSAGSAESHMGSPMVDSLAVSSGTYSNHPSPLLDDDSIASWCEVGPSPLSPDSTLSPRLQMSRLLADARWTMSTEQAEGLVHSMRQSHWHKMLGEASDDDERA